MRELGTVDTRRWNADEFRQQTMSLGKRELLILSDQLMMLGHDAAEKNNRELEDALNDASLELWLRCH